MSRRAVLRGVAAAAAAPLFVPRAWAATPGERRLVLVLLRGGLDGLAAVPPVGDRRYAEARGSLALSPDQVLPLDDTFALHPALEPLAGWYAEGSLLPVHAVGLDYRGRSHFDAQDALECGAATPTGARGGWLNRALATQADPVPAAALGAALPLVLRGDVAAASVDPTRTSGTPEDFLGRVQALYASDPMLAGALAAALEVQGQVADAGSADMRARGRGRSGGRLAADMEAVGTLLAAADGPRVMVLDGGSWDTHARQGVESGALARELAGLAGGLVALRRGLADTWAHTTVVCVSEFGRTVAPNGTGGTDHGTGGVALVAGGPVRGGRVVSDWPGLRPADRLDGRDLRPTLSTRAMLKAVLHGGLGISDPHLDTTVFPDSAHRVRPRGWFRAD